MARPSLLPLWEKVSPKATDEGCSSEVRRWHSLEHPSTVSALRADPPSPTRGEGKNSAALIISPVPRPAPPGSSSPLRPTHFPQPSPAPGARRAIRRCR
ncbi:hypothetical protein EFV37_14545 [Mesorhizobium loti]|nr:hypothetical protein EB229_14540 [Mesorhizobium jarvisii]QKD09300.1 hypothetical protein EFV37_14545 [Mesorhizobium loti]